MAPLLEEAVLGTGSLRSVGGLAGDPVVQGQERDAEDPERMLGAQLAALDEDVELLGEAGDRQRGQLVRGLVDVGEVVPGLTVVDAAAQGEAAVGSCRGPQRRGEAAL